MSTLDSIVCGLFVQQRDVTSLEITVEMKNNLTSPTRKCIFTHLRDTESLAFVCCILCILHVLLTLFSMFLLTARGIRYQASATRTQIHRLKYPSPSRPPDLIKHRYKCTLKHPPLHLDSGEVFRWAEMSYSSNWYAVAHRRPGNTVCAPHQNIWHQCGKRSTAFISPAFFSWKLDLFYSTVVLQSPGFSSTVPQTTVDYECGRAEPEELMPALDSFVVARKVFTFAAKYQTCVNMTTRTL